MQTLHRIDSARHDLFPSARWIRRTLGDLIEAHALWPRAGDWRVDIVISLEELMEDLELGQD